MKRVIIYTVLLCFTLLCPKIIWGQTSDGSMFKYTPDFKFKEGVYPNFESVKHNRAIPKSRILADYSYADKDFFDKILSQNKVVYYDNLGNKLEVKSNRIWGYARNGFLYVGIDNGFYRITMIGGICHFIAYKTYETYNYPYNSYYSSYPYSVTSPTSTSTELQQYLLDFDTGNIVDYDVEGMEVMLMRDPELHDEYAQLSKKKKKQLKFMYIRKFNERNPLFLYKN